MSSLGEKIWTTKARRLIFPVGMQQGEVTNMQYPKSFGELCIEIGQGKLDEYSFLWHKPSDYSCEFHTFRGKPCKADVVDAWGKCHLDYVLWRIRPKILREELNSVRCAMYYKLKVKEKT